MTSARKPGGLLLLPPADIDDWRTRRDALTRQQRSALTPAQLDALLSRGQQAPLVVYRREPPHAFPCFMDLDKPQPIRLRYVALVLVLAVILYWWWF
jgi:hypothetical protein